MARRRTVLTPPPPPRARKTKADPVEAEVHALPGRRYRLRYTEQNPFGEFDPPAYSDDLAYLTELAAEARQLGMACMVEETVPGGYRAIREGKPLTVADLAREGLARERTTTEVRPDGSTRSDSRWEISPEGQRRLYVDQVR